MTVEHLNALPYVKACLLEALRLEPPAQMIAVTPMVDDGAPRRSRGVAVFGDDATEFRPERMTEEKVKKLPKHGFKPFGHTPRNCIGSDFAMQEATVAVVVLFQKFDFSLVDPGYELRYQTSLNRKPKDLKIFARLRPGVDVLSLHRDLFIPAAADSAKTDTTPSELGK
ncbi:hypothetical protein NUW58_g10834 [Xylaria curta]|uniref:Uncharacterized protein n=1 Tax=Xylaria curta TaxID=42375 RepID=A0ACC1MGE1_9PEZI|nr:hypothetical protein NUW58_g10834 [Xylaria curta]